MNIEWTKKRKGFSLIYTCRYSDRAIVHTRFGMSPGVYCDGRSFGSVDEAKSRVETEIITKLRIDAQSKVDGLRVAGMLVEFQSEFAPVYGPNVLFPGVGPMQSFLGWAINKGYITVPAGSDGKPGADRQPTGSGTPGPIVETTGVS
jgi:hypothetical protein